MHKSGHVIETSIYLLMFIIRPTKGCDERAITAPLPAIEIKKQHLNVEAIPMKFKWKHQNRRISTWMTPRDHGQATFCPESRCLDQLVITDNKHAVILFHVILPRKIV